MSRAASRDTAATTATTPVRDAIAATADSRAAVAPIRIEAATRIHLHVRVSDLEASKAFYARFFGAGPVKERPGYAKFLPDLGPINLALSERHAESVGEALAGSRDESESGTVERSRSASRAGSGSSAHATGIASPVNHVGIQVESTAIVMQELERVKASGLPVREEMSVDCCHANQDKFWVEDPDGVRWEVYHLNHDLEDDEAGRSRTRGADRSRARGAPLAESCAPSGCCSQASRPRADGTKCC